MEFPMGNKQEIWQYVSFLISGIHSVYLSGNQFFFPVSCFLAPLESNLAEGMWANVNNVQIKILHPWATAFDSNEHTWPNPRQLYIITANLGKFAKAKKEGRGMARSFYSELDLRGWLRASLDGLVTTRTCLRMEATWAGEMVQHWAVRSWLSLIPSIPYSSMRMAKSEPEHRIWSNPWALEPCWLHPDYITPPQKEKKKKWRQLQPSHGETGSAGQCEF